MPDVLDRTAGQRTAPKDNGLPLPDPAAPAAAQARACSRIGGLGHFLPERCIESRSIAAELGLERFGADVDVIERLTGIRFRHLADESTTSHDLACAAAARALADASVEPGSLDVIVVASVTREYFQPSIAHLVQARLGAANAYVFDITNACLGFMDGLLVLDSLIAAGRCRTGLVCAGETTAPTLAQAADRIRAASTVEELHLLFSPLTLGDAGVAAVIEPRDEKLAGGDLLAFHFASAGEHHELCRIPTHGNDRLCMTTRSVELFQEGTKLALDGIAELLEKTGWSLADVDLFVPHQMSVRGITKAADELGVPRDRWVITVDRFGNTASTALPLALAHAYETGRLGRGMKVVLAGVGSGVSTGLASLVW